MRKFGDENYFAYVTSNQGRVNVINVADPTNPVIIGYYAGNLFLNSSLIYVSCYERSILILERSGIGTIEHDNKTLTSCGVNLMVFPNPLHGDIELTFTLPKRTEYKFGDI